eukprot:XP_014034753.1 PREDICTED: ribonuclease P protein subunit p30-like isoform X2 [Salmo salar]
METWLCSWTSVLATQPTRNDFRVLLKPQLIEIGKPKCVSELFGTFPIVQGKSRAIKVLNRLTVVASRAAHFKPLREYKAYDLVAAYPKTEKLFHAACMEFTIDIICVAATEKQPFFFKRSSVNGAIERGVFFEVSYTPAIRDSMRRHTIANALNLMEACKGKNVIVTIGAERCDGANLCHCYYPERCPEAYCLACQKKMAKLLSHPTVEPSTYMEK